MRLLPVRYLNHQPAVTINFNSFFLPNLFQISISFFFSLLHFILLQSYFLPFFYLWHFIETTKTFKKYLISYCDILFLFKYITPQKASRKFSEGVKMYHKIIHNDLYDTCFMYWPSNSIPKTCLSCVKDVIKVIL